MITPELSAANLDKLGGPNRGRIVAVSLSPDGRYYRAFTIIGGRSEGSRNRFYKEEEDLNGYGNYVRTAVHNPDLQQGDPAATLYDAHRRWGMWDVASNGEQTYGIGISLAVGAGFKAGQKLYKNEGKRNGYTARITVAVNSTLDSVYIGKVISTVDNPAVSNYPIWTPGNSLRDPSLNPGEGYFTATYNGQGGLEPNREEPWGILLEGDMENSMDLIWSNLDPKTKAGLCGKEIERGTGRFTYSFRSIHSGRPGYR